MSALRITGSDATGLPWAAELNGTVDASFGSAATWPVP
jgi:hypothetical protein